MTPEELVAEFEAKFEEWKDEVMRLVLASDGNVERRTDTLKVGGYTYDQIVALFMQELNAHIATRNAHGHTLTALGGMTTGAFDALKVSKYPRTGFPFTQVKGVVRSVSGNNLTITGFTMLYLGREVTVPTTVLTLANTGATPTYIRVVVSGTPGNYTAALSASTSATESMNTIIIARVTFSGSTMIPVFTDILRVGDAAISQTPRGKAIPATTGTPTTARSLDSGWFTS